MWVEKEKELLSDSYLLIVPTLMIFVLGLSSSQQADHADIAELGNGEVNNRVGGAVEILHLFGMRNRQTWNWLPDFILKIFNTCSDLDAGDLRCQSPRRSVTNLRRKDIDHDHLTAGKDHVDPEGLIVMKD